jgi:hypothetical protein
MLTVTCSHLLVFSILLVTGFSFKMATMWRLSSVVTSRAGAQGAWSRYSSLRKFAERASGAGLSVEVTTIATHLDTTLAHLSARRSDPALVDQVQSIPELRKKRNALIVEGDAARNRRKVLSKRIGQLMQSNDRDGVVHIKEEVDECHRIAATLDAEKDALDMQIQDIIIRLPNFLDDR